MWPSKHLDLASTMRAQYRICVLRQTRTPMSHRHSYARRSSAMDEIRYSSGQAQRCVIVSMDDVHQPRAIWIHQRLLSSESGATSTSVSWLSTRQTRFRVRAKGRPCPALEYHSCRCADDCLTASSALIASRWWALLGWVRVLHSSECPYPYRPAAQTSKTFRGLHRLERSCPLVG